MRYLKTAEIKTVEIYSEHTDFSRTTLKQCSSLCKLRISNHTLEIERGRYQNIDRQ